MNSKVYDKLPWYEKLAINLIRNAPVPRHMAYIMDGNRRYADKIDIEKQAGIAFGFQRFIDVMEWSLLFGVKEITVYALSIENFKRPKPELDFIFNLMETKFESFLSNVEYYLEHGIRFNIIGDISLLPKKLQMLSLKIMQATKEGNVIQINIALSYTSREEICSTIKSFVRSVEKNELDVEDIDESYFNQNLYTRESPEVDLLIRTSGETRLSDFLLWQSASSKVFFIKTLWPEITLWKIICHLIYCQQSMLRTQTFKVGMDVKNTNKMNYHPISTIQLFINQFVSQVVQKIKNCGHLLK